MKKHKLLEKWLAGTTCKRHQSEKSILAENDEWILLKHFGHSEYINRVTGNKRCPTETYLFHKETAKQNLDELSYGRGFRAAWDGTYRLGVILQECEQIYQVVFEKDYNSSEWYEEPLPQPTEPSLMAKQLGLF